MSEQQAADPVSRRGFLKTAGAAPALGLVLGGEGQVATAGLPPIAEKQSPSGPPPGPALDDLQAELTEYGFVIIPELIPRAEALRVEERVREIMRRRPDADKIDQHLPGFFNQLEPGDDALFVPLVTQPVCLALARAFLGEGFQMTEVGCRWRKPGAPAGPIRLTRPTDSMYRDGLPVPGTCLVLAFAWMLNDLTRDMGASYYLPFSQHASLWPRPDAQYKHVVYGEAPAGSLLIHHGGVWHGFGANTTTDKSRVGLMGAYIPFWIDLVTVGWQPMKRSVRDRMPEIVQKMNQRVIDG
jgi:hypothetical protein